MPIVSQGNTPIQINPVDADPNQAVGIGLPMDASNGAALSSTFTTQDQIRSNIKNLLSTIPGERINEPTFGSKLWEYLFDNITEDMKRDKIDVEIRNSLAIWIPEVDVIGVSMAEPGSPEHNRNTDLNRIGVRVYYRIRGTQVDDSVDVSTPV
tara:strand:- start:538 stop:996 length:459 start_codon:yes stop_codon:yes gene_type:complete